MKLGRFAFAFICSLLFSGVVFPVCAQVSLESEPVSWGVDNEVLGVLTYMDMNPIDHEVLYLEDEDNERIARTEPMRFAYRNEVALNPDNSGRWTTLPNGDRIWILGIHSEGALSLGLTFSTFKLPKGAALYVYNPDRTDVIGALTEANNKNSKVLTTSKVAGDELILEYYEPYKVRHEGQLHVRTVAHTYREISLEEESIICNENPVCSTNQDLLDIASSVALITVDDGTRWCTGTLVNNANFDGKPFILTHVQNLQGDPNAWHVSFRYSSSTCDESFYSKKSRSISGASVRVADESSGVALIEMSSRPHSNWKVYYAGWDVSGATPHQATTLHHPLGAGSKRTHSSHSPTPEEWEGFPVFTVNEWDDGHTDYGSTGAPLFDESLRVCGILKGGFSSCDVPLPDYFSRIASGNATLAQFLDPFNQGRSVLNGTYFDFSELDRDVFKEELGIFPMPASESFNLINENSEEILTVRIFDMAGRMVQEDRYTGSSIDISTLPFGSYVIEAEMPSKRLRRAIVKAR